MGAGYLEILLMNTATQLKPVALAPKPVNRRTAFRVWEDNLRAHETNGNMTPEELRRLSKIALEVADKWEALSKIRLAKKAEIEKQHAALKEQIRALAKTA